MKNFILILSLVFILLNSNITYSKVISTEEWARSAWGDIEKTEVDVKKISKNLFLLYGLGGNIAVSIGDDGVLIVDSQIPIIFPKIKKAIEKLSNSKIVYTINTHWHWDHADGNLLVDPDVTKIISHSNARENMKNGGLINHGLNEKLKQNPYPINALPVITHEKEMSLYFNNEKIDIVHFGPAHTTGDSIIFFNNQNAIHLGDVFFSNSYPFIDVDNGGSLDGMIEFLEKVILMINDDTIIMPGHGDIASTNDIKETILMLKTIRNRILELINKGQSLEDVLKSQITRDYDNKYNTISMRGMFIDRAYESIKSSLK